MAVIFVGSTDLLAANHTSRFIEPFLRWLFHGSVSGEGIEQIHFLIRKAGHVCEYAVLCVLFWWALQAIARWRRAGLAVLFSALFAASDEFHQSFVPTRGASVHDVLIDTAGAMAAMAIITTVDRVFLAKGRLRRNVSAPV